MLAWRRAVSSGRACWLVRKRMACSRHGDAAGQAGVFDLLGGVARLLLVVGKGVQEDFRARAFLRTRAAWGGGGRCF